VGGTEHPMRLDAAQGRFFDCPLPAVLISDERSDCRKSGFQPCAAILCAAHDLESMEAIAHFSYGQSLSIWVGFRPEYLSHNHMGKRRFLVDHGIHFDPEKSQRFADLLYGEIEVEESPQQKEGKAHKRVFYTGFC